jgi:DNA-directed RNA polymerase specialized sigma subunit
MIADYERLEAEGKKLKKKTGIDKIYKMKPNSKELSQRQKEILEYWKKTDSARCAKHFGISNAYLGTILFKAGVSKDERAARRLKSLLRKPIAPSEVKLVRALYKSGKTRKQIAEKVGRSVASVARILAQPLPKDKHP